VSLAAGSSRPRWWTHSGLLAVVAISAVVRWPGLTRGGFANHDVAGILYNGMLLRSGGLPYVDSLELKPPGTFYLALLFAGPHSTDIAAFQVWANVFALASLAVVGVLGTRLWGPAAGLGCAVLYALHDAVLDSMDANYVTWAQLPLLLAALATTASARAPRKHLDLLAGVLAGCALLLKQPTGASAIAWVLACAVWPGQARGSAARRGSLVALGVLLAHLPVAAHYAVEGQFVALVRGYLFNARGLSYVAYGTTTLGANAWIEGPLALLHTLALPLALAGIAAWPPADPSARRQWAQLWLWVGLACLSASAGFRFYKGYFLAVLPPLCLLAVAPWGITERWRSGPSRARALAFVLLLVPLLMRQVAWIHAERLNRRLPHDLGGRRIAEHIAAHSPPGARVWIWGWHLWDVYPYTGMLSGSRMYKSTSLITTDNDATWRRPRSPLRFRDGPLADALIRDLETTRPHYIALGSTVPHAEFSALRRLLQRDYRRDRRLRIGKVELWSLREPAIAIEEAATRVVPP